MDHDTAAIPKQLAGTSSVNDKLRRGTAVANTSSLSFFSSVFSDGILKPGRIHEALGARRGVDGVEDVAGTMAVEVDVMAVDGVAVEVLAEAVPVEEVEVVEVCATGMFGEGVSDVETTPSRSRLAGLGFKSP